MNFAAALDYFDRLGFELRPGVKFDLANMTALLGVLDHPERAWPSVHIAGTNGKGSVAAMVESVLRAAGYRTGLYTSPHLERLTERIRIAGDEIAPEAFATAFTAVHAAIESLLARGVLAAPPSFFETLTATGFIALRAARIEIAVVEVGMGGRLDATNVLAPAAAAITPIGFDHEKYLGATLTAIAGEKAGIIKPGLAVVSGRQPEEAAAVLAATAASRGAHLLPMAPLVAEPTRDAAGAHAFRAEFRGAPVELRLGLAGRHQVDNALTASRVIEALAPRGWRVEAATLQAGLAAVRWPGRLERVAEDPAIWLDGAHNPLAARALADFVREMGWRPILIYASLRDKAIGEVSEELFPLARHIVLTAPASPRALSPAALREQVTPAAAPVETAAHLAEALARARELAGTATPILVTGSLYLVGEARRLLLGEPLAATPQ